MLETRLNLKCDDCGAFYPNFKGVCAPVDGAIYTQVWLRTDAKDEGWTRVRNDRIGSVEDICPDCSAKRREAKKAARK